ASAPKLTPGRARITGKAQRLRGVGAVEAEAVTGRPYSVAARWRVAVRGRRVGPCGPGRGRERRGLPLRSPRATGWVRAGRWKSGAKRIWIASLPLAISTRAPTCSRAGKRSLDTFDLKPWLGDIALREAGSVGASI